jgi:hypothetical protein
MTLEFRCLMEHVRSKEPLESANCTTPPLPIDGTTLGTYNCTNITGENVYRRTKIYLYLLQKKIIIVIYKEIDMKFLNFLSITIFKFEPTDFVHEVNLYYDAKDVFGGINMSALPALTTPPTSTVQITTSEPQMDIEMGSYIFNVLKALTSKPSPQ